MQKKGIIAWAIGLGLLAASVFVVSKSWKAGQK
jgi:hypothetical protein